MNSFHFHKKYEIYYQLSGTRRYLIEDSAYSVNAGDVVVIDKDEVHKTSSTDNNPHSRIVINFNEEFIAPLAAALQIDVFAVFHQETRVITGTVQEQGQIEALTSRLLQLEGQDSAESNAVRRLLLCQLLLLLSTCLKGQQGRQATQHRISNHTIDEITSYVSANYREHLSLSDIAARFYLSPYYLSRLFKRTTNLTLVEYINSVRLRAAKEMLETSGIKVSQVAEQAGFATSAHFTRMFKAATGLSPQQYRKLYHTNKQP